jgi:hypothetical protein
MATRLRMAATAAAMVVIANLAYGVFTPVAAEEEWGCGRSCHQNGACHAPLGVPVLHAEPARPDRQLHRRMRRDSRAP